MPIQLNSYRHLDYIIDSSNWMFYLYSNLPEFKTL